MTTRFARIGTAVAAVALAAVIGAPAALAYPPNPPAPTPVAGGVILVSQQTANQTTPRKLLQPAGASVRTGQPVKVKRGAVVAIIASKLVPGASYRVAIRIDGDWNSLGTTVADSNGEAQLPVVRILEPGVYPVRLTSGADKKSPLFFNVIVQRRS